MFYEAIKGTSTTRLKRLTDVKKAVFEQMLNAITTYKESSRKQRSHSTPPKVTYADKFLLMYYREYRTQFHIGVTYGIAKKHVV